MEELAVWVNRARQGDLQAFARIVREFQHMAHGYAYSILGDFHYAQDAAQEAFVVAYQKLGDLQEPAAFPGWLRALVRTRCGRLLRRKRRDTVPLEEALGVADVPREPEERHEEVLAALHGLSEHQRTVLTLFYIGGYSQNELADFLEVPVTTVQKRLHDARRKLKERMLLMVEETLKDHAPDERFSQEVIARLLAKPRPLQIPNHPVQEIVRLLREALPDYEYIEGEEIVSRDSIAFPPHDYSHAYHLDHNRVLRTETTVTMLQAAKGRPLPVRLVTAGRVFRPDKSSEDEIRLTVFHQFDAQHIASGLTLQDLRNLLGRAMHHVLGPVTLDWKPTQYTWYDDCYEVSATIDGRTQGVAGCGMLADDTLRMLGHDPDTVSGIAFGTGLERLAMLKYGIEDIRKLWQPPFVITM